jgi:spore coat-associated protein N
MSRFKVLRANPRRTLAAMATLLIAVGVTAASGATFTAQTANPSNKFTAGTLSMSNSKDNAAILTASNMKPGDTATGSVDIANTGSVSGAFTLSKTALTNSDGSNPMANKLNLVVTDCGTDLDCSTGASSNVYTGTLAGIGTGIALGNFGAGVGHRYKFDVEFDSSATDAYQGDNAEATFTWDAS